MALFAFIAAGLIIATRAASPNYSLEAEDGEGANRVAASGASGGNALLFQAASASTDFHTCFPDAFCTPSNQIVTMNGMNIRYVGENANLTSLTQMQKIKNAGFNSVRLVLDWEVFQPASGPDGFAKKPSATTDGPWEILNKAVANAKTAGVYVILDPIHFGGEGLECGSSRLCIPTWARVYSGSTYQGSARSVKTNSKDYIQKVAADYANEPTVVAIDLVNEPKPNPFGDEELISMFNTLIGWVREKDPDKILIIEPDSGNKLYSNFQVNVNNKQLTNNVATITTSSTHKFVVGQEIKVSNVDATFNGNHKVTAVTANTVSYSKTAANVASTSVSPAGTVKLNKLGLFRTDNLVFSHHHYFGGARNSSGTLLSGCSVGGYSSSGYPCGNFTYENKPGYVYISPSDLKAQIEANQTVLSNAELEMPIWIGEWGIIEGGANAIQWRKDMTSVFKEMRIGRAYWQYANTVADPPSENMSMTVEGSSTPGAFKSWIPDIL